MTVPDRDQVHPFDPRPRARRQVYAVAFIGGAVCTVVGWWAARQIEPSLTPEPIFIRPPERDREAPTDAEPPLALDRNVFDRVALWNPAPVAAPVEASESASALPRSLDHIVLVGVMEEGGVLVAALYDLESHRLHLVRDGETLREGGHIAVETDHVTLLVEGERAITLPLRRKEGHSS